MAIFQIDNLQDPRISAYLNLKEKTLQSLAGGLFIGEGNLITRRLLASSFKTQSLLVAQRRLENIQDLVPPDVPLYVVPNELIHEIVGYKFHAGILSLGHLRGAINVVDFLDDLLKPHIEKPLTLLICPEIKNADNLGTLIRNAAAFGVDGLITGPASTDIYSRRSIRVSMGTVFSLPCFQVESIEDLLIMLKEKYQFTSAATVIDHPQMQSLKTTARPRDPDRLALLLGAEDHGLPRNILKHCTEFLTIPMHHGTDSLNISVAGAIFLYHLT